MDPIFVVVLILLAAIFAPISLIRLWFSRPDYDESRVLWDENG